MTKEEKLSPEMQKAIAEQVKKEMKKNRSRKAKIKLGLCLLGASLVGGGAVAVKHHLKEEFKKDKVEVQASTTKMRAKADAELDKITGTNKVIGIFGRAGGKAAQWLRIQQAPDKK